MLTLLLGVLELLQYRWIAEVSVAQRGWLQGNLEARLNLLSASFNQRIENAATALFPEPDKIRAMGREAAYAAQYLGVVSQRGAERRRRQGRRNGKRFATG